MTYPFLHSTWYAAALPEEISRTPLRRVFLDEPVVLYRRQTGEPVALSDICPHRFAPLSKGKLIGDGIKCPYHGLEFDSGGRCLHNPNGNGVVPPGAALRAYALAEKYGMVWIWMGKASEADPDRIPDFSFFGTRYRAFGGCQHVKANYELLNDNILDGGAHIDFIHAGLKPEGEYTRHSEFRREGDTIHSDGWWLGAKLMPFMRALWPDVETGDIYNFVRWDAPSVVLVDAGLKVPGATLADPPLGPAAHFYTPETATTTHYLWLVSRRAELNDDKLDEFVRSAGNQAFEMEDRPIIEAQQTNMVGRDFAAMRPVSFSSDGAALLARRILARKIAEEQRRSQDAPARSSAA